MPGNQGGTHQHGESVTEHVGRLVDAGGRGPLLRWEPVAGDEGRGGHDRHAGDPVQDSADVRAEIKGE